MSSASPTTRRVLLTGGAGFIGTALARRLAEDHDVVVYDLVEPAASIGASEFVLGDILSTPLLQASLEDCDAVFHLASQLGVAACQSDEGRAIAVNVSGTESLAAAVRASPGVKHVVALSSSEVYGEGAGRTLREQDELAPRSTYGWTKVVLERIVSSLANTPARRVAVIRPFNVYGPGQRPDFVVPRFACAALTGQNIKLFGSGDQTRTFTYIEDAIDGILGAYGFLDKTRRAVSTYNIASRETVSIATLANLIKLLAESDSDFEFLPYSDPETGRDAAQEIVDRVACTESARRDFEFRARVCLSEGLAKTLASYGSALREIDLTEPVADIAS